MALQDAVAAIRVRGESLWPALEPAVVLIWPNERFQRPANGSGQPSPFVRIEVRWSGGDYMSIGAPGDNLVRREGHIWCYAFIPIHTGEARAHQLVAEAAGMFEGEDFSGIVCAAMMPGGDVDSEEGNYFGQSGAVPFDYDETA